MRIKSVWTKCEGCGKKSKSFRIIRGHCFCYNCSKKFLHILPIKQGHRFSLEKSLNRVYKIKGYAHPKDGSIHGSLSLPSILIGHKIKIILADKND